MILKIKFVKYQNKFIVFHLDKLTIKKLGNFIALIPTNNLKVNEVSNKFVEGLDYLRDELSEDELKKRNPEKLNPKSKKKCSISGVILTYLMNLNFT